jgi:DNA-directed RNA polymerase specialized sigma subunit
MADKLEADLKPHYDAWKASPTPETTSNLLTALHPTIEGAIKTHVGASNPVLLGRARVMAVQGLPGYDPKQGRLQTYMYNHLQSLKRVNRQQTQIIKLPERVSLEQQSLRNAEDELRAVHGQEPTDSQLAEHTGFSPKRIAQVRSYHTGMPEGYFDAVQGTEDTGDIYGGTQRAGPQGGQSKWAEVVYNDLDDYHKKVMEHSGFNGRPVLANHRIAAKLNRSPGAISQAKARIQTMLDEEHALSPFEVTT